MENSKNITIVNNNQVKNLVSLDKCPIKIANIYPEKTDIVLSEEGGVVVYYEVQLDESAYNINSTDNQRIQNSINDGSKFVKINNDLVNIYRINRIREKKELVGKTPNYWGSDKEFQELKKWINS